MKLTLMQWIIFVFAAAMVAYGMTRAGIDNLLLLIPVPLLASAAFCALLNYLSAKRPPQG